MSKVMIVVGNPTRESRTRRVAEVLVEHLVVPGGAEVEVIELADYAADLFAWDAERVGGIVAEVGSSDLVVFASPTYKAGYTGLLKAFLDRFTADGLAGVVAVPVQTGATDGHSMVATHLLGPLLTELGALVPGRGFYLPMTQLDDLDERAGVAAQAYVANLRAAAGLVSATIATSPS
jgi:FMN reductase